MFRYHESLSEGKRHLKKLALNFRSRIWSNSKQLQNLPENLVSICYHVWAFCCMTKDTIIEDFPAFLCFGETWYNWVVSLKKHPYNGGEALGQRI